MRASVAIRKLRDGNLDSDSMLPSSFHMRPHGSTAPAGSSPAAQDFASNDTAPPQQRKTTVKTAAPTPALARLLLRSSFCMPDPGQQSSQIRCGQMSHRIHGAVLGVRGGSKELRRLGCSAAQCMTPHHYRRNPKRPNDVFGRSRKAKPTCCIILYHINLNETTSAYVYTV